MAYSYDKCFIYPSLNKEGQIRCISYKIYLIYEMHFYKIYFW